jgi:unsaturated rhamnogalacturonyl hydrolase
MKNFRVYNVGIGCLVIALTAILLIPVCGAGKKQKTVQKMEIVTWQTADKILTQIKAPKFPNRDFKITDFGAVADEKALATTAINKAIDACNKVGGGHVIVPKGIFLTGSIHLKSNVDLHLEDGATLRFSANPKDYLPVVLVRWEGIECMNYSPLIYAYKQENIAVTGKGMLDGQATNDNWWAWKSDPSKAKADAKLQNKMADEGVPVEKRIFGEGHYLRPNFIEPYRCKNILIENLSIKDSPMWEINPELCTNVIIRGLTIKSYGPNNDGCDPESSKNVLIENCTFITGDDCIAIKSGRNDDGRRIGVPSENVIIRNCVMQDGHAAVCVGSEISGGCRNVFVENCRMDSPNLSRILRFKSNAKRGGKVENIFVRNITVGTAAEAIITVDFMYEEGPNGKYTPVLRNVWLDKITAQNCPRVFFLRGYKGSIIDGIKLSNSVIKGLKEPEVIENVGHVELDNVTVESAQKVQSLNTRANTL